MVLERCDRGGKWSDAVQDVARDLCHRDTVIVTVTHVGRPLPQ